MRDDLYICCMQTVERDFAGGRDRRKRADTKKKNIKKYLVYFVAKLYCLE